MINKKAQIAFALYIVLALIATVAGLIVMAQINSKTEESSSSISDLTNNLEFTQQYIISQAKLLNRYLVAQCTTCSDEEIKTLAKQFELEHNFRIQGAGNFFSKLRDSDFTFEKQDNTFTLKLQNLFVQSQSGSNKLTRNFNLCPTFNQTDNLQEEC